MSWRTFKILLVGNVSLRFSQQITKSFLLFPLRLICASSGKDFSSISKDRVPISHHNSVVYLFACQCESSYIRRTPQRLGYRINKHFPFWIRNVNILRWHILRRFRIQPLANISLINQFMPKLFPMIVSIFKLPIGRLSNRGFISRR